MKPASVIAVLVLLTSVAAGAWVIWGDGSGPASAANQLSTPDPTPRLPYVERPRDPLVMPPNPVVFSRRDKPSSIDSGLLTDMEREILSETGVVQVVGRVTRNDVGTTLGVWRFMVRDGGDPREALEALDALYQTGGHELTPTNHPGLRLRRWKNDNADVFHGHYVHGQDVLRVEGHGPDAEAAVAALVEQQLARSPAEER